mmetsp:Transcript_25724/g.65392  ORF Transcript_25724/g.65392 Transcript_25724/m.65392 type:complete len:244 (+) Transcript_25724:319-1050(+)
MRASASCSSRPHPIAHGYPRSRSLVFHDSGCMRRSRARPACLPPTAAPPKLVRQPHHLVIEARPPHANPLRALPVPHSGLSPKAGCICSLLSGTRSGESLDSPSSLSSSSNSADGIAAPWCGSFLMKIASSSETPTSSSARSVPHGPQIRLEKLSASIHFTSLTVCSSSRLSRRNKQSSSRSSSPEPSLSRRFSIVSSSSGLISALAAFRISPISLASTDPEPSASNRSKAALTAGSFISNCA